MAAGSHLTPEEIIARIDDWKGKDVHYEELGGGITNHNYIVWVDGGPEKGGEKYVMRVPGMGTDMFIDRNVERDCMIQAAKAGVGPGGRRPDRPGGCPHHRFRRRRGHASGYHLRASRPPQAGRQDGEDLPPELRLPADITLFDMLRHYKKIAVDINAPDAGRAAATVKALDDIEAA